MSYPTVLLVDPSRLRRRKYQRLLQDQCEVILATDAEEAAWLFMERRPRILMIRADQPGDSGLELCQRVRSMDGGDRAALVLYGPSPKDGLSAASAKLVWGFDAFFDRELGPEDLQTIARVAARPILQRSLPSDTELPEIGLPEVGLLDPEPPSLVTAPPPVARIRNASQAPRPGLFARLSRQLFS